MNLMEVFITAGIGAIAIALVGGFFSVLRMQMTMIRKVTHLANMDLLRATDFEAVAKVQRPMLSGIKASLEAHRDGKCNGNVIDAHSDITEGIKEYDKYLATLVRRGK